MTEIGYYNYYNVEGRRTVEKPDDWYQKMVNRYESDELKSVDEMNNPYSDFNQSVHALDEKLSQRKPLRTKRPCARSRPP